MGSARKSKRCWIKYMGMNNWARGNWRALSPWLCTSLFIRSCCSQIDRSCCPIDHSPDLAPMRYFFISKYEKMARRKAFHVERETEPYFAELNKSYFTDDLKMWDIVGLVRCRAERRLCWKINEKKYKKMRFLSWHGYLCEIGCIRSRDQYLCLNCSNIPLFNSSSKVSSAFESSLPAHIILDQQAELEFDRK